MKLGLEKVSCVIWRWWPVANLVATPKYSLLRYTDIVNNGKHADGGSEYTDDDFKYNTNHFIYKRSIEIHKYALK